MTLGFSLLVSTPSGRDRDGAGLHGLGQLAHELDMQQAVFQAGSFHHHMVGELEFPLETAGRDAAMEEGALLLLALLLSPRMVSVFSFASRFRSSLPNPATAMLMRYVFSSTSSIF